MNRYQSRYNPPHRHQRHVHKSKGPFELNNAVFFNPFYYQAYSKTFLRSTLQPTFLSPDVIPVTPALYPDQFFPEPLSLSHRNPTKRLIFETQLSDLIAPGYLLVEDTTTAFNQIRRDTYCSISRTKGEVILMGHKKLIKPIEELQLRVQKVDIVQSAFIVKIKNMSGICVLTLERKTLYTKQDTDYLDIWFGNKAIPIGRIRKPNQVPQYTVFGEIGHPVFNVTLPFYHSDFIAEDLAQKYVIQRIEDGEVIGTLSFAGSRKKKVNFGTDRAAYPSDIQLQRDLTIAQKSLLMSRVNGSDKAEELERNKVVQKYFDSGEENQILQH